MATTAACAMGSRSLCLHHLRLQPSHSRLPASLPSYFPLSSSPVRSCSFSASSVTTSPSSPSVSDTPPTCSDSSSSPSFPSSPQRFSGKFFPPRTTLNNGAQDAGCPPTADVSTTQSLSDLILSAAGKALKPALVSLLVAAVMWYLPAGDALAAQGGGRVGGNGGFSASRARSYSAPSQSYSAPSSRGGYSGPSYIAPSPSFSAPFFFAPTPFFGPTIVMGGGGFGGGLFNFLLLSFVAVFVVTSILNFFGAKEEEEVWEETQRSSVVRLQVGLMGTARQLQKDLERMASRADTSSTEGLHYVLQEAVLSLLRNPDYCIYGYSTSDVTGDSYAGEQAFNRLSLEERSKFKEETFVNVGDVRKRIERTFAAERIGSEYIVVTIIAAAEGTFTLPEIKSQSDLRSALTQLGSITADELQAVEILWTPENEEDTLTTKDMLQDYPLLRPL